MLPSGVPAACGGAEARAPSATSQPPHAVRRPFAPDADRLFTPDVSTAYSFPCSLAHLPSQTFLGSPSSSKLQQAAQDTEIVSHQKAHGHVPRARAVHVRSSAPSAADRRRQCRGPPQRRRGRGTARCIGVLDATCRAGRCACRRIARSGGDYPPPAPTPPPRTHWLKRGREHGAAPIALSGREHGGRGSALLRVSPLRAPADGAAATPRMHERGGVEALRSAVQNDLRY